MKNVLDIEYTPIQELQYASESISSFASGTLSAAVAMTGRVKSLMPSIISGFKGAQEFSELTNLKDLSKEEQLFLKSISKVSFAEVRALRADVPEGFSGDFFAYAKTLQACATPLSRLAPEVLNPYTVFLGQLVSTRNVAILNDDKDHVYKAMEAHRKEGYAHIAKFFTKKKPESTARISEVIARNDDWKHLFASLKAATDAINSVDRQLLKQLMAQAEDYLNILQDMLKSGKLDGLTPETSKALANGAFQVASQVEYYSVIYFRILGLTSAVRTTMARVTTIFG